MAVVDSFPEPIIHRIQSFLSHKESARTTLLSKAWGGAWSTRSTIDLDESHFPNHCKSSSSKRTKLDRLTEFATKTFRRYDESNLRIDTFRLCLESGWYSLAGFAKEWALKALQMGATDVTLRCDPKDMNIPMEEVFGSERVVRLCLRRLDIDRGLKVVKCTGLTSLTLSDLDVWYDSFCNILSCCPLIETLSLSLVEVLVHYHELRSSARPVISLRKLVLRNIEFESWAIIFCLGDLSSKFPNLKDLTVVKCYYEGTISSSSLETLNISVVDDNHPDDLKFDVPSIRKFTFEGSVFPKLISTSGFEWVLIHISVMHTHGEYGDDFPELSFYKWFCNLNKFLSKFRGSNMHLCLHVHFSESFDYRPRDMKGFNVCEVEDLTMDTRGFPSLSFYAFLDGLFRICRPRTITQYVSPPKDNDGDVGGDYKESRHLDDTENTTNNDLSLFQALETGMKGKSSLLPSQYMYGLRDLEEVNAQKLFDEGWRPQPLESVLGSLYDKSISSDQRRFRFQLKWKS